jgi:hypothetical protein
LDQLLLLLSINFTDWAFEIFGHFLVFEILAAAINFTKEKFLLPVAMFELVE